MKLYNAWYCPFAQRVWMALVHKGIDFKYVEVDPYDNGKRCLLADVPGKTVKQIHLIKI